MAFCAHRGPDKGHYNQPFCPEMMPIQFFENKTGKTDPLCKTHGEAPADIARTGRRWGCLLGPPPPPRTPKPTLVGNNSFLSPAQSVFANLCAYSPPPMCSPIEEDGQLKCAKP